MISWFQVSIDPANSGWGVSISIYVCWYMFSIFVLLFCFCEALVCPCASCFGLWFVPPVVPVLCHVFPTRTVMLILFLITWKPHVKLGLNFATFQRTWWKSPGGYLSTYIYILSALLWVKRVLYVVISNGHLIQLLMLEFFWYGIRYQLRTVGLPDEKMAFCKKPIMWLGSYIPMSGMCLRRELSILNGKKWPYKPYN